MALSADYVSVETLLRKFSEKYKDDDAIAAAILHPKFKTSCISNNNYFVQRGLQHIQRLFDSTPWQNTASGDSSVADDPSDDDAFFRRSQSDRSTRNVLDQFPHSSSTSGVA